MNSETNIVIRSIFSFCIFAKCTQLASMAIWYLVGRVDKANETFKHIPHKTYCFRLWVGRILLCTVPCPMLYYYHERWTDIKCLWWHWELLNATHVFKGANIIMAVILQIRPFHKTCNAVFVWMSGVCLHAAVRI